MYYTRLYLILSVLLFPFIALAQEILNPPRLQEAIVFDGLVNEASWKIIPVIPLKMQTPNFGQEPTETSEIRMAYDDDYLYLSGKLFLSDSSLYRPTTFKRDAFDGTTDYFGFIIDSYNDNENALAFFTTPTGLRWDGTLSNDAIIEEDIGLDWNTFWDAATQRTPYGYDVEMRLPWTSLRFQDKDGEVVMGIIIWWFIAAKYEHNIAPLIPLTWGNMSSWKPSQAQEYRFKNVYSKKPFYLTPYLLGGYQHSSELNEAETEYIEEKKPKLDVGLDIKYSLTSNLTLDLTANTDFAQVEVDDQQVNLTRFSLFFPEKRQFFLERASIFDFRFEDFNRLFYSRRIGIYDSEPVRIYGGARLQGRIGDFDLGIMNMQTEAPEEGLKSENFSLARLRRQVFNPYSYTGLILSNRMDFNGNYNTTYGADAIIRVAGDEYMTLKWAQSFTNNYSNEPLSLNPSRIYLKWERRIYDGFAYNFSFSKAGKDWQPDMGFEERENFSSLRGEIAYGNVPNANSNIMRWRGFLKGTTIRDHEAAKTETTYFEPGMEMELKSGWNFNMSLRPAFERVPETFSIGEVDIHSGEYNYSRVNAFIFSPFTGLVGFLGIISAGGFYDGNLVSISFSPRYKVSPHLQLEGTYQFNKANFNDRNETFESHVGRIKAEYMANTKFAIAGFLQYSSFDKQVVPNVRLRYNPKEGNDLYIVLNGVYNSNHNRELPILPRTENMAVVLKYTYTFIL